MAAEKRNVVMVVLLNELVDSDNEKLESGLREGSKKDISTILSWS